MGLCNKLDSQESKVPSKKSRKSKTESYNYYLKAIIIHSDELVSNLYRSFIKINDNWYAFNELGIVKMPEKQVLSEFKDQMQYISDKTFCLFYEKSKRLFYIIYLKFYSLSSKLEFIKSNH